jgi:hypothetical protein
MPSLLGGVFFWLHLQADTGLSQSGHILPWPLSLPIIILQTADNNVPVYFNWVFQEDFVNVH